MKEAIKWVEDYEEVEPDRLIVRCKDCKHFLEDYWAVVNGVPLIVAHEICDFWGDGSKTAEDGWCFMAERKEAE